MNYIQAENEALKAVVEQQKLEMKAASDTLHAITKENAQLQVQLEAERAASRACAAEKVRGSPSNIPGSCSPDWMFPSSQKQFREEKNNMNFRWIQAGFKGGFFLGQNGVDLSFFTCFAC